MVSKYIVIHSKKQCYRYFEGKKAISQKGHLGKNSKKDIL
nr:MAG TPA_asm: Transcriptional repressor, TetR family Alpha Protein, Transcriptional Repressor [Inoviridae sp.]DAO56423.1 MAG TPA: Transcriptional repressor, TetR family Alpha Protein, Transcriptional Repressor [Inoviridae sp.]